MRPTFVKPATLFIAALILLFISNSLIGKAQAFPIIDVSPSSGEVGTSVTVNAADFIVHAEQSVNIDWDMEGNSLGKLYLDKSGAGSGYFNVPLDASPGTHTVIVCAGCNMQDEERAKATFEVSTPPTDTPYPTKDPGNTNTPTNTKTQTKTNTPTNTKIPGQPNTPTNTKIPGQLKTPTFTPTYTITPTLAPYIYNPPPAEALFNNPSSPLGVLTSRLPVNAPCSSLGLARTAQVFTFDDVRLGELTGDYGRYVSFPAGSAYVASPPISPRSGTQALTSSFSDMGSINHPITMHFATGLKGLGLFVGRETPSEHAYESIVAILTGYGTTIAGEAGVIGVDTVELPGSPTAIDRCLIIHAERSTVITSATLEFFGSTGHSVYDRRWMDNLTIELEDWGSRYVLPTVNIIHPIDNSVQTTDHPYLQVDITEDRRLNSVVYYLNDNPNPQTAEFTRDNLNPTLYHANITILSGINRNASNRVRVVAHDDQMGNGEDTVTFTFQPASTVDIVVEHVEFIQAAQYMFHEDIPDNFMPMIHGKPTLVRVYARLLSGPPTLGGIAGAICRGLTDASGCSNPIRPLAPVTLSNVSTTDLKSLRDNLSTTLNFLLPADWIVPNETLRLTAYVNYSEENVDECCLENNFRQAGTDIVPSNSMNVTFVPVSINGWQPGLSGLELADRVVDIYPMSSLHAYRGSLLTENLFGDFTETSDVDGINAWDMILADLFVFYHVFDPATSFAGSSMHYYGMVDSESIQADAPSGKGNEPGFCAAGYVAESLPLRSGNIAAHELGHNENRGHSSTYRGAAGPDPNYPNPGGYIDDVGINVRYGTLHDLTTGDLMSYRGADEDRWISGYTYEGLWHSIDQSRSAIADRVALSSLFPELKSISLMQAIKPLTDMLGVFTRLQTSTRNYLSGSGYVQPDQVRFRGNFFNIPHSNPIWDDLAAGPYTLELQDQAGNVLFSKGFAPLANGVEDPGETGVFSFIAPWVEGTSSVVFKYNGVEIGRRSASPNPPQVTLLSPNGGENWPEGSTQSLSWSATDPDGDALTFMLQYSCDNGTSWGVISTQTDQTSLDLDSSSLAGGEACQVRLLASDGLNTVTDISDDTFSIARKDPYAGISNPQDSTELSPGWPVILMAIATDPEDGPLSAGSLQWASDVDGNLGSGESLVTSTQFMTPGVHTITLTGTDSDGQAASVTTTIDLVPPPPAAVNPIAATATETGNEKTSSLLIVILGGAAMVLVGLVVMIVFIARKHRNRRMKT